MNLHDAESLAARGDLWRGTTWVERSLEGWIVPHRFPESTLGALASHAFFGSRSRHGAGVGLRFRTDSREVRLRLSLPLESPGGSWRTGVRVDGGPWTHQGPATAAEAFDVVVAPQGAGSRIIEFRFPPYTETRVVALELDGSLESVPPSPSTQLFFGDSITQGARAEAGETWAERVAHGCGCEILNLAVGGSGMDALYAREIPARPYHAALVAYGTNDWGGQVPLATFLERGRELLSKIRAAAAGISLVLLTPLPRIDKTDDIPLALESYRAATGRLAEEFGATLLHGPDLLPEAGEIGVLSDKLHPAPLGHQLMAERVLDTLVRTAHG